MNLWRPPAFVKVKVLGLAAQGQRLLVAAVRDDQGKLKGVRPLGGSVDFGETREEALRREFEEEAQTQVQLLGDWAVFENIYRHEGHLGHEIVFLRPVLLERAWIYAQESMNFCEADGAPFVARWVCYDRLLSGDLALFPHGLLDWLQNHESSWRYST